MQRLEVSCAERPIYGSLSAKGLMTFSISDYKAWLVKMNWKDMDS
jgi:hypothetical protein